MNIKEINNFKRVVLFGLILASVSSLRFEEKGKPRIPFTNHHSYLWGKLFCGTVLPNKTQFDRTVTQNNILQGVQQNSLLNFSAS